VPRASSWGPNHEAVPAAITVRPGTLAESRPHRRGHLSVRDATVASIVWRRNGMRVLLFVAAMVALGLAGWSFNAVVDELRRSLPPQFGELDLRTAVAYHIWTPAASDTARRRYVWFHLWASLFAVSTGILLWLWGKHVWRTCCYGNRLHRVAVLPLPGAAAVGLKLSHSRCRRWARLASPGKPQGGW
jgi:hypothetical protein